MSAPTLPPMTNGVPAPPRGRKASKPPVVQSRLALPAARRRPGRWAAGAAVLALGAAVGALAVGRASSSTAVLVVTRPVPVGAPLTRDDLGVADLKGDPALSLIRASEVDSIVGKIAAVSLTPGTTLASDELGGALTPLPGDQVVGLALRPGLLPVRQLQPGDNVFLVPAPDAAGASAVHNSGAGAPVVASGAGSTPTAQGAAVTGLPAMTAARVTEVGTADSTGMIVVDVMVPDSVSGTVAAEGAAGRVALTLAPAGTR